MDAVAVDTAFEAADACPDADRSRAVLSDALAASRAPRRAAPATAARRWTLTVRVSRLPGSPGAKAAEATIVDDAGKPVTERTLTDRDARSCLPLARALGAWATLVIDAELDHAHDAAPSSSARWTEDEGRALPEAHGASLTSASGVELSEGADRAPASPPRSGPEVGGAVYIRSGIGSGGVVGFSPFVVFEVAAGWLLRPSLALGRSTTVAPLDVGRGAMLTHVGARLDFCRRIPGNYIERRGLEADLCAGADIGVITSDPMVATDASGLSERDRSTVTVPRATLGPAVALRGELGAGLTVEVRGGLGANLVQAPLLAESTRPAIMGDAQIALGGRLP